MTGDNWEETLEARIRVRLTPKAARDEVAGWHDGVLRVRVTAPPVEGKANAALEALVAKALRVPKSRVRVVSGAKGRDKTLAIEGIDEADARARLERATS